MWTWAVIILLVVIVGLLAELWAGWVLGSILKNMDGKL